MGATIERMRQEEGQHKIKLAELNVVIKSDNHEIKRLQKELDKVQDSY